MLAHTTLTLSAAQRVRNGARWLDENFPGWEDRINIATLSLEDGNNCICGQVFAGRARRLNSAMSGYTYAEDHLFAEANSWISGFVLSGPITRRRIAFWRKKAADGDVFAYDKWAELVDDAQRRAYVVARGLGFLSDGDITFAHLQKEWVALLKRRAAKPALITV